MLIAGALQTLRLSEQTRQQLDEELSSLKRDRDDVVEQMSVVSRQKSALAEELINTRKELEKHSDAVLRLAKTKEELTKEKAELAVQITACERENRQQGQVGVCALCSRVPAALRISQNTFTHEGNESSGSGCYHSLVHFVKWKWLCVPDINLRFSQSVN